jgi:hypothetical protein
VLLKNGSFVVLPIYKFHLKGASEHFKDPLKRCVGTFEKSIE